MSIPNKQKELTIGKVVYVVSDSSGSVIPAIVAEESVIKTLNGNTTSWKLFIGPEDRRKVIDSRQVNGVVYSTIKEVHEELFNRLNEFLNSTIDETKDRAKKWYAPYYVEEEDELNKIEESLNQSSNVSTKINNLQQEEKIDTEALLQAVENNKPIKQQTASSARAASTKQPKKSSSPKSMLREMVMPPEDELKNNILEDENGRPI